MPDELLTIFKLCFLVLLYLFFFRVLRAVWTEVNTPSARLATEAEAPPKMSRRSKAKAVAAAGAAAAPPAPTRSKGRSKTPDTRSAPAVPTRLVAIDPAHLAGLEFPLVDGMSIGRGAAASIVLEDSFLSQRHSSFDWRDGSWFVSDLGSTNGTYVNRARVEHMTLLHLGDHVQVGNIILEVR